MRSTPPSSRRLHSRSPRHNHLAAIAQVVDDACVDDPGHVLVHLQEPCSEVTLGLKSSDIGVHPFELLAGFTAPEDWWAFGIRARGRAHHLDDPGRVTEGIATTFLVDRNGGEASRLRAGDVVTPLSGPAQGTVADLCRRVLGVATPAAPASTHHLWATLWLDGLLTEWARPERRRAVSADLGALTALHPATGGEPIADLAAFAAITSAHAHRWSWSALRHAAEPLPLPDGPLPPAVAAWMDDGFFARWTIGAYPSLATLARDLRGLLGDDLGRRLLEAVVTVLEPTPSDPLPPGA